MDSARFVRLELKEQQISEAIVEDLMSRPMPVSAVVVTKQPYTLLSVARKRWLKKLRKMRIERARLLSSPEANRLSQRILTLEKVQFALLAHRHEADIFFSLPHEVSQLNHGYEVVYISNDIPTEQVQPILNNMPPSQLAIVYE